MLPREISQDSAKNLVGESATWYCQVCENRHTAEIQPEGVIACPVCGSHPAWNKKGCKPTVGFLSRYQKVMNLCAEGSPLKKWHDETIEQYGDFIEDTYRGMPLQTQRTGWRHFGSAWAEVDKLGDYLLTAKDLPQLDIPRTYTKDGLARRYYDPRREHNVVSFSDLGIEPGYDDGSVQFSLDEAVELVAYDPADCKKYMDEYFKYWYLDKVIAPK